MKKTKLSLLLALTSFSLLGIAFALESMFEAKFKIRICVPISPSSALPIIAHEKRFFSDEDIETELTYQKSSAACIQEVLEGKADFAASTLHTVVGALTRGEQLLVISELQNSIHCLGVAYPIEKGISDPSDLKGKKIALVKDSGAETFIRMLTESNDVRLNSLDIVRPNSIADVRKMLESGRVDGAVIWEPVLSQITKGESSNKFAVLRSSFFSDVSVWVGKSVIASENPVMIDNTIRALRNAQAYYESETEEAQIIATQRLGFEAEDVPPETWAKFRIGLGLSSVLLKMMSQAEGALMMPEAPLVETSGINIFQFLYPQSLRNLDEDLVTYE